MRICSKNGYFDEFVPNVETFLKNQNLPRKAIILLDNAPCHPNDDELASDNIKALFLPPNVTSFIQPLDQGVLENIKRNYRKKLLKFLIEGIEENKSVPETLKSLNVKDAVYWIAEAWDEVKSDTIKKSWRKIIDTQTEPLNEEDIRDWINADEQQEITDEMIVNNKEKESSDEDSEDENRYMKISHTDRLKAIEIAIEYIEQQEEATPAILLSLEKWRNITAEKRQSKVMQTTIKGFFKVRTL
ncbi:jerky protein homolog-like [Parasteatoda tepidariorum]|uniref:jerky protein homolog-like n=1 Tax=Parasteatoda tepidariorum TaxID=114398 RepID=UPI0039BCEA34